MLIVLYNDTEQGYDLQTNVLATGAAIDQLKLRATCLLKVTGYLKLYDFIYVYIYATKTGILKS